MAWVACQPGGRDDDPADADTDGDVGTHTGDTGEEGPPGVSAVCTPQPHNALRVDCVVKVSPPGPLAITFEPTAGGAPRTMSWPDAVGTHRVTLWRMHADTDYSYTATATATAAAGSATGSFTTGSLPRAADIRVAIATNAPGAPDDLLFSMLCDLPAQGSYAVVIDDAGEVVWYQDLGVGVTGQDNQALGLIYTSEGDVGVLMNRDRVRRFGLDGALVFEASHVQTPGFSTPVHHDLFVRGGYTYVLDAREVVVGPASYVLDGLLVFDAAGAVVAEWELADHVTPSGDAPLFGYWGSTYPGAYDWSHGNGLYVDEDLNVLVSFKELDAILKVVGDPLDPAFGDVSWVLDGADDAPWPSDFVITDPLGLSSHDTFADQHHPSLLPSGNLLLFDNGDGYFATARALELALDETLGTAEIVSSWPVARGCTIGGGAYELSNGNLLATCALHMTMYEIDRTSGAIVRTMTPTCNGVVNSILQRGIPVEL